MRLISRSKIGASAIPQIWHIVTRNLGCTPKESDHLWRALGRCTDAKVHAFSLEFTLLQDRVGKAFSEEIILRLLRSVAPPRRLLETFETLVAEGLASRQLITRMEEKALASVNKDGQWTVLYAQPEDAAV